jgi:hypothetical protein
MKNEPVWTMRLDETRADLSPTAENLKKKSFIKIKKLRFIYSLNIKIAPIEISSSLNIKIAPSEIWNLIIMFITSSPDVFITVFF